MASPDVVPALLETFVGKARSLDLTSGGGHQALAEIVAQAQQEVIAAFHPAERAGFSFRGQRLALDELARDLPEQAGPLCEGLAFAAEALSAALRDPGSLACGGGACSSQLEEPGGAACAEEIVTVTRLQCLEVLAAGFFGVVRRSWEASSAGAKRGAESLRDMPAFTFDKLWEYDTKRWKTKNIVLTGVLLYFQQVASVGREQLGAETLVITRKAVGASHGAAEAEAAVFCPLDLQADGVSIHAFPGEANLQADFANAHLGGGVMSGGGSQEEAMFVEYTELLATIFLVEKLLPHEAVEISGAKRMVEHNLMAARRLPWPQQFCRPAAPSDGEAPVTTVALDAICFNSHGTLSKNSQYEPEHVRRELRKCGAALVLPCEAQGRGHTRCFVTGLWGCGAFRGDPELKFIVQWISCSLEPSITSMTFCPWDQSKDLKGKGVEELIAHLAGKVPAKRVLHWLLECKEYQRCSSTFRYLLEKLRSEQQW